MCGLLRLCLFGIRELVEAGISEIECNVDRDLDEVENIEEEAEEKDEPELPPAVWMIFLIMPNIYPMRRNTSKKRLFPFAVREM